MIDTHETNTTFSVSDLDGTGIVSGEANKSLDFVDLSSNQTITGIKTFQGSGIISSSAITITTAAQPNITSLGTLTTLTVDDITINGSTISDSGDLTLDIGGDLNIDVDGTDIVLKDGGTFIW